ncbi:Protein DETOXIFICATION [Rhynchospora pubera]|uniref:Protein DETOXIFICATION n=1 Tax=Rhynchospora pubera TaxID=906938 RepID=A0AAV8FXP5_9POAL|nr:Protein DETOXIFICATION [Rhynchospora pubera]
MEQEETSSSSAPLLLPNSRSLLDEIRRQLYLAGPLVLVNLLQYCIQVISLMFAGHLGELALSGASVATSFANVTGFSVLLGMGTALDTFCGQAYGAKQYHTLGMYLQRAMFVLLLASIPLAMIWAFTGRILKFLGQNPEISAEAGIYTRWLIPSLFAYGLLQCHVRFLQSQNIVLPMVICSGITVLVHVPLCWVLVVKAGFGNRGAALATAVSYWINLVMLGMYVNFSRACRRTWTGLSKDAFSDLIAFVRLAIPSAFMICLEYWAFEMVVLLAGFLPDPKLETSVLSITLNTMWMVYMIPTGLSSAISIRVSNELGSGNPRGTQLSVKAAFVICLTQGLIVATITILVRDIWGFLYSNEMEVVRYVSAMMPILATSDFMDGIQCTLSGVARGCGWQNICSIINLAAYYLVGIPSAVFLAFSLHFGGQGLWMGIICAMVVQLIILVWIIVRTDWHHETVSAQERIQKSHGVNESIIALFPGGFSTVLK